jgi:hypothetical protein
LDRQESVSVGAISRVTTRNAARRRAAPGGFAGLRQPVTSDAMSNFRRSRRRPMMKTDDAKALAEPALDTLGAPHDPDAMTSYLAMLASTHDRLLRMRL